MLFLMVIKSGGRKTVHHKDLTYAFSYGLRRPKNCSGRTCSGRTTGREQTEPNREERQNPIDKRRQAEKGRAVEKKMEKSNNELPEELKHVFDDVEQLEAWQRACQADLRAQFDAFLGSLSTEEIEKLEKGVAPSRTCCFEMKVEVPEAKKGAKKNKAA